MNGWMQGFYAPLQHFRDARNLSDLSDGEPRVAQCGGRSAGGDELDVELDEAFGEGDDARFVVHRQQCTSDRDGGGSHKCAVGGGSSFKSRSMQGIVIVQLPQIVRCDRPSAPDLQQTVVALRDRGDVQRS